MGKLKGKVAIITGSTSGMGRASAIQFAKEGAKVVVTGRNKERAQEVVNEIKKNGGDAIYVIADTSKKEDLKKIVDETLKAYKTVDILFNNAGSLSLSPFMEIGCDEWEKTFKVNVDSALILTRLVAPIMKEKGKGVIINTSSIAGLMGTHGFVGYVTSKHAMSGLTKSMAIELGPEIRTNAICPGAIETAMLDSIGGVSAVQAMVDKSPLKRSGTPQDIATVAVFLASDDSSFITGQLIRVDGGIDI